MQLRDLRFLVTGGASGIGAATVRLLRDSGACVVVADIQECEGGIQMDAADGEQVERGIAIAVERLGGLDGLVCCAGRLYSEASLDSNEKIWDECIAVNLKSVWLCARATHTFLARSGCGSIVVVGSAQGLRGKKRSFPYGVAKGGLLALARTLAVEFAPLVRVNVVIPGQIESVRTEPYFAQFRDPEEARRRTLATFPMGRLGKPQDVASAIGFLLSPSASWITGSYLTVDGGRDAAMLDLSDLESRD